MSDPKRSSAFRAGWNDTVRGLEGCNGTTLMRYVRNMTDAADRALSFEIDSVGRNYAKGVLACISEYRRDSKVPGRKEETPDD